MKVTAKDEEAAKVQEMLGFARPGTISDIMSRN
jgi:hypothetical protein